jgi:UDP-glucuronate 4-epimerase
MKILVTGSAGFIGHHLVKKLLSQEHEVVGLDNLNSYYDINLKKDRLKINGIIINNNLDEKTIYTSENYKFIKADLINLSQIENLFQENNFEIVINLAAQAGVRYSITNPHEYIKSNILGFTNLIECAVKYNVKKFIYASSSSVYGLNDELPFNENQNVDKPVSLYAATKKSNELIAHAYSSIYNLNTIGLRFFTVYGPYGRPDMAPMIFLNSILNGIPIKLYNEGNMSRDFSNISDIIAGLNAVINFNSYKNYEIFNIAHGTPIDIKEFIIKLEKFSNKKAIIQLTQMQKGDVYKTWADINKIKNIGYVPSVNLDNGIEEFVNWYLKYYK